MSYHDIVPYTCLFLDASWQDFFKAAQQCTLGCSDRSKLEQRIQHMWTSHANPNPALQCLSVRSGLDLYLQVHNFPPGSEVIMSAINIGDMATVVRHHGIKVIPLDVNLETLAPKVELIENLITEKTVALLLAHIYGKQFDMEPFIALAQKHRLKIIEDSAEAFSGFKRIGHPESDIALFSFGSIKFCTAFGGAVAKVKDKETFSKMKDIQEKYSVQSQTEYLRKVMKYSLVYLFLNCPGFIKPSMFLSRTLGIDHKKIVVRMIRGFPDRMVERIREQPSTALLYMMYEKMSHYDPGELSLGKIKAEYISERLPDNATQVGNKAHVKNYWLFPVVVDNPDEVLKRLNAMGVDAYRGATQLNIIEPTNGNNHLHHLHKFVTHYPHEAKFLIDHVVYLPVNKLVPFYELDRICHALDIALRTSNPCSLLPVKPEIPSKL